MKETIVQIPDCDILATVNSSACKECRDLMENNTVYVPPHKYISNTKAQIQE